MKRLLNPEGNETATPAAPPAPTATATPAAEAAPVVPPAAPTAPAVPPPAPKTEDRLASKLATIQKRDRELAAREKALAAREKEAADIRAIAAQDPAKALEMLGTDYGKVTDHILKSARPVTAEDRVAALEQRLKQQEKDAADRAEAAKRAAAEEADNDLLAEIEALAYDEANEDKYEFIAKTQNAQLVRDVMKAAAAKGTILTLEQAAETTEAWLDEQASKTLTWKKIQSKLKPAEPAKADPKPTDPPAPKTATLTNDMTAAPRASVDASGLKSLSRDSDIAEAVKLLKFSKK
jgi:hypothetical protein